MKIEQNNKIVITLTNNEAEKIYNDLNLAGHTLEGCEDADFRPITYKFIEMLRKTLKNE